MKSQKNNKKTCKMNKISIKLRCYPDSQLKQLIHQTAGNNRFIYNYFLNLKNTSYQENKTSQEWW